MNVVKDESSLKIYNDKIDKYDILYTLEKTSYPYYLLSKIEVFKDNELLLEVTADIRQYDGYTFGSEYKKINILSQNANKIIEINHQNIVTKNTIFGNKNEILYYEKKLFDNDIYLYICDKNIYFSMLAKDDENTKKASKKIKIRSNNINL